LADTASTPPGDVLAALDIGTNSFHLVVARVRGEHFDVVTREKQVVRLGHGGGDMKVLAPEAIDRGVAALQRMQRIAAANGAVIRAVATSAVREALNADEFLRRARAEAGIEIEVISGLEEARLIHLGVLQSVPVFDQRLLLVDIGGGSTEVLVGQRGETIAARSFKLGAVSSCRDFVRSTLATFEREVNDAGFDVAITSSGTGETIARMVAATRGEPEARTYNGFEFTAAELDAVVTLLAGHPTAASRRGLAGLDASRADIGVAGALVLQAVAQTFRIARFTFSEGALREGVLLDSVARFQGGALHHLRDVSRHSIRALAERCDEDVAHSAHVATLALELFDGTQVLHGLGPEARDYLEAGALLANVGLVIAHSKHHLHAYYVIRNCELTGLTDHEIEIIALIARYHRKSAPKPAHAEWSRLPADDRHLVRVLAGLLRVAIGLDRSHDGRVVSLQVRSRARGSDRSGDRTLVIEARADGGADLELELYTANDRSGLLAEVLERPVEIVAAAAL
jgi:exopolyphosphatase/guanosine-5'-triphosphate,3'-diphosphate pyrophosphatase